MKPNTARLTDSEPVATPANECSSCFFTDRFPGTVIDASGRCSACRNGHLVAIKNKQTSCTQEDLLDIARKLRSRVRGRYHCVVGTSGGLDSSYVLYVARRVLDLNPLAVMYDNGMRHERANANLRRLCDALQVDLQIMKSAERLDIAYVRSWYQALRGLGRFWGICNACHYILPVVPRLAAQQHDIPTILKSSNIYEGTLHWPKGFRLRLLKARILLETLPRAHLRELPERLRHLLDAVRSLRRFRQEFPAPSATSARMPLGRDSHASLPCILDVSRYLPWNIDAMVSALQSVADWRPLFAELPMRFDCLLEDTAMNATYRDAGGVCIHAIIANNLIYDGTRTKKQLQPAVAHYHSKLNTLEELESRLGLQF